jgi:multidrug efflux system membrane fusion protein
MVTRIRKVSSYVYYDSSWRRLSSPASARQKRKGIIFNMNFKSGNAFAPMGLGSALMAAMILAGCNNANSSAAASARAAGPSSVPVAVVAARRMDLPVYLSGLGSVTPSNSVSVRSRVDGQLVEVAFKEGQQVQKGQLLAVIDPRPFEVQLAQAQATLFKDQAQLRDAKLNFQRFQDLLKQSGAVSQQQVDTQGALVDQLDGAARNDQAAIDSAKLQITYCHITAPINGRIGLRLVDVGNIVHAADANPLLIITQLQPIAVLFSLPEDQLQTVAQHMKQGTLTVEAYSRDDQTKMATGELGTIDNQIDQTTGTGRLKAMFQNKDSSLWPNEFVNARLLLESKKNAIVVPSAAIQRGPQGTFAYVVKADKTAEVRPVTVSLAQGNLSAIGQGLAEGEIVVTDGQDKLKAGMMVDATAATGGRRGAQGGAAPSDGSTTPGSNGPGSNGPGPRAPGAGQSGADGNSKQGHRGKAQ